MSRGGIGGCAVIVGDSQKLEGTASDVKQRPLELMVYDVSGTFVTDPKYD